MKKLLALLLAVLMIASLAACGAKEPAVDAPVADAPADAPAADAPAADAPAADAPAEDTPAEEAPAEEEADSDLAYITGKGKMLVGITIYEPMNYFDDAGELTGFDTEFAQAVCEKLGLEAEFVEINWDTKEVELAAKSIDCIWNGMTITEERMANMSISAPYVKNAQVIVVKADSDIASTADLVGKTVVAEMGSAGEAQVIGEDADADLAQAEYVGVAKQTDCLMEIKAGTAAAAVLDWTLAKSMVGEGTDFSDLKILEGVELATTADLVGKTVVAEMGSAGEAQITGEEANVDLAQAEYVGLAKQTDCLMEIKAGTADAAVLDWTLAKSMVGEGTDFADLTVMEGVELATEEYGIAFRQGSDVTAAVNAAIAELVADGTLPALAEKYGLALAPAIAG